MVRYLTLYTLVNPNLHSTPNSPYGLTGRPSCPGPAGGALSNLHPPQCPHPMTHTIPQIVLRSLTGRPLVQALQVVRYQAGQEFAAHMDSVPSSAPGACVALPYPFCHCSVGRMYLTEVSLGWSINVFCALLPAPCCKYIYSDGAVSVFEY